jgi:hypothetical protein
MPLQTWYQHKCGNNQQNEANAFAMACNPECKNFATKKT